MVDYTKPAMRDETWRRWKGGKKLADDLRTFYTAKHVFGRLAANNAVMASASATAMTDAQAERQKLRGQMINSFFNNRTTDRGSRQLGSVRLMGTTSNDGLPGQSGPKR